MFFAILPDMVTIKNGARKLAVLARSAPGRPQPADWQPPLLFDRRATKLLICFGMKMALGYLALAIELAIELAITLKERLRWICVAGTLIATFGPLMMVF
jgi:hypothetical protein